MKPNPDRLLQLLTIIVFAVMLAGLAWCVHGGRRVERVEVRAR